ncbi:hypothetical protein LQ948_16150 [Jiella sp. MQZ9-1]|uniref:Uncharacterized protein n=1 Tax=Jiella flava TaxID=2816857 RepID=A0A939FZ51_9HYPH|nr:hypothetical protein [Jiella flava]MBO0664167.1 hypothetical protein [Jiella flava]MCD2472739.1 hypothetical protein [Jiella flava]
MFAMVDDSLIPCALIPCGLALQKLTASKAGGRRTVSVRSARRLGPASPLSRGRWLPILAQFKPIRRSLRRPRAAAHKTLTARHNDRSFAVDTWIADDVLHLPMRSLERGQDEINIDDSSDFRTEESRRPFAALSIEVGHSERYHIEQKEYMARVIGTVQQEAVALVPGGIGHDVADRQANESRTSVAALARRWTSGLFSLAASRFRAPMRSGSAATG